MSDDEWAVIEPALPAPAGRLGKCGRPGEYCRRASSMRSFAIDLIPELVRTGRA